MIDFQMFQSIAAHTTLARSVLRGAQLSISDPEIGQSVMMAIRQIDGIHELILLAQSDAMAAHAECLRLRKKVEALEQWEETCRRYELLQINPGQFVYRLKGQAEEPSHYLCADCFNERVKSILQSDSLAQGAHRLICNRCAVHLWVADGTDKCTPNVPEGLGIGVNATLLPSPA